VGQVYPLLAGDAAMRRLDTRNGSGLAVRANFADEHPRAVAPAYFVRPGRVSYGSDVGILPPQSFYTGRPKRHRT
jgi:hypothetical protein